MKATAISIAAFFFCQICNAQNVGIGTATPTQKLEVAGTTKTTGILMTPGAGTGKIMESDSVGNGSLNHFQQLSQAITPMLSIDKAIL